MRPGEERRVYEAHMASFADTWLFATEPFEVWAHWLVKDAGFDPSLWFLVEAGDELAGIALTPSVRERARPGVGANPRCPAGIPATRACAGSAPAHVRGVREAWPRTRVGLGVDAENPTGAVRVYERAGMHVSRTNLILEKVSGIIETLADSRIDVSIEHKNLPI